MKKKLFILIPAVFGMLMASCSTPNNSTNGGNGEGETATTKYTVTFANTNMNSVEVNEGGTLSRPTNPQKSNQIFGGWYLDAGFTQQASFPMVISANTTIYAQFFTYQAAFAKARVNTIGEQVAGYEYDYDLEVSATYMNVGLKGTTHGNAKYNKNSKDVKFYDAHQNSGALFYDGYKYEILKGNNLHSISLDENNVVTKYKISNVGSDYNFDSSSFAKALFEYEDSQLKSISKTSTANEYKLSTGFNFSKGISLIGNYVNHPIVEKIIGKLPETSVNTGMYVTFDNGNINTYRYEMSINVSGLTFSLIYSLEFKNVGVAPTIVPQVFNNTYVTDEDIASAKTEINNVLNAYKTKEHSAYDYLVKTAVDYEGKNAIDATINGFSKRKVDGSTVYYLNDYEVDTDHKNADLYKEAGLEDCHAARAMLSTGEVHDLKKKLTSIGGTYDDLGVVSHVDEDNYYLFDILEAIESISFIQKITDTNNNKVTYAIGGDEASAIDVLNYINNNLRLNPLGTSSVDVKAFGSFDDTSVTIKSFKFNIVVINGVLSEINLKTNGSMVASFPGSRDFQNPNDAGFSLNYKLTVTDKGDAYEPANAVSKVK